MWSELTSPKGRKHTLALRDLSYGLIVQKIAEKCYNISVGHCSTLRLQAHRGADLSSTFVLYRLDSQVACQRYRQNQTTAERKSLIADLSARLFPQTAPVAIAA